MTFDLSKLKKAKQQGTYHHPKCDKIVITDAPQGLAAIRDPQVMAVIWQRTLTPELQEAIKEQIETHGAKALFDRYASRSRSSSPFVLTRFGGLKNRGDLTATSLKSNFSTPLYNDMNFLTQSFANVIEQKTVGARLSIRAPEIEVPNKHGDLFGIHIDQGIDVRLHTTYAGQGMGYVPQNICFGEGKSLREQYEKGILHTDQLSAGDVVIFKGASQKAKKGVKANSLPHFEIPTEAKRMAFIVSYTR